MPYAITHSTSEIVAVELVPGGHVRHIFEDQTQVADWLQANPGKRLVGRLQAKGRQFDTEDHRGEFFPW